jgi:hypothetical protein
MYFQAGNKTKMLQKMLLRGRNEEGKEGVVI